MKKNFDFYELDVVESKLYRLVREASDKRSNFSKIVTVDELEALKELHRIVFEILNRWKRALESELVYG